MTLDANLEEETASARLHNIDAEEMPYDSGLNGSREEQNFLPIVLGNPRDYLVAGENLIALQLINVWQSWDIQKGAMQLLLLRMLSIC